MRAEEFNESAADELKRRLPSLRKTDYSTIDNLMQRISSRHHITGKKLHDLFVSKYGETPDHWIKKYRAELEEDWQKVNKRDKTDGMSPKAVKAYRRENPGSKLKTAVTTKPSKLKKGSKAAKRRKSFCARMSGMKKAHASAKTKRDPDSPINKALRRWNCESIEELQNLAMIAEQKISEAKKRGSDGKACWDGYKYAGTENGKDKCVKVKKKTNEAVESNDDVQKIKDFIKWSIQQINLEKPYPKIILSKDTKQAQAGHHTGVHTEDAENRCIWVYIGDRNLVDIFRTIFHELVHEKQSQLNMIQSGDSYPGSPIEAMADMIAGKYIKIYGKQHPEIFQ
jgi:hypothetical protein